MIKFGQELPSYLSFLVLTDEKATYARRTNSTKKNRGSRVMVKPSVPGRCLQQVRERIVWNLFFVLSFLFLIFPFSLGNARYSLKYCLKGLLNQKQSINQHHLKIMKKKL